MALHLTVLKVCSSNASSFFMQDRVPALVFMTSANTYHNCKVQLQEQVDRAHCYFDLPH